MANKIGPKIKEARTAAGLSQTKLAELVDGVTAADIGKAERGEKELTQAQLKQIAKATGVTQKSLLEAAEASTYGTAKTTTKKTGSSSSKTSTSKSSTSKTSSSSAKKTASSSKKTGELTLTATEKKLVELYRAADTTAKKNAMAILKGEEIEAEDAGSILSSILGSSGSKSSGLSSILGNLLGGDE